MTAILVRPQCVDMGALWYIWFACIMPLPQLVKACEPTDIGYELITDIYHYFWVPIFKLIWEWYGLRTWSINSLRPSDA